MRSFHFFREVTSEVICVTRNTNRGAEETVSFIRLEPGVELDTALEIGVLDAESWSDRHGGRCGTITDIQEVEYA